MAESNYIVYRAKRGHSIGKMEGRWDEINDIPYDLFPENKKDKVWIATPTGSFEYRDDGAYAEVYEVGPKDRI